MNEGYEAYLTRKIDSLRASADGGVLPTWDEIEKEILLAVTMLDDAGLRAELTRQFLVMMRQISLRDGLVEARKIMREQLAESGLLDNP